MGGTVALVVGAGEGRRFGGDTPKQYLALAGQPLMRRSLLAFITHPEVTAVQAVINPDHRALYDRAAQGLNLPAPVAGGAVRQDSVARGLESLSRLAPDNVLIHDAARPLVDHGVISRVIAALAASPGAVPALPVADTLKRGENGRIEATVDRRDLWRAQTPQGFRFADILAAHRRTAGAELTDDAAVAERAGLAVAIVDGAEDNIKITTEDDLIRAGRLLGQGETRIGLGVDAHQFGPGDHVMLCGVAVPFEHGLVGHSDADVGLHALTDALLGTIGAGDIGSHFPPSDAKWKGASSDGFLRRAGELVAARGGRIVNIDVTLICEKPKIGPHRQAMTDRIAGILGVAGDRVSVKATTTDRMGFTGRGEGIAAQAVATVVVS
ncbi:MAG TPA: bifunctional 2-C-methyl-D-erythritol 4-phosphate cytidylyltransferase/2-C-methyl-D-erythritol 2,4-cyclodiphosphate synthase [Rhodospirillales bacterium]